MVRSLLALVWCASFSNAAVTYRVKLTANEGSRIISVPAEQYVAGVLAGESSVFQSEEALKAMAIAARTYAARMRPRHAVEGYDFCSTTHCQRFNAGNIPSRLLAIAQSTAGKLLWYQGKPVFAVYSRDCGGITESASALWPDIDAPYLIPKTDPYCTREGANHWSWNAGPAQIAAALRASGLKCPQPLQRVAILNRTVSRRARTLDLEGPSGSIAISESSFRFAIGRAVGWNLLRGDRYEVRSTGNNLNFEGSGEGHGAGLCQHGADEMGRQGFKFSEILAFYYPGTTIALQGTGLHWVPLTGESITLFTTQPQQEGRVLAIAEQLRNQAARRLQTMGPPDIRIYFYPDIEAFRNATAEPGWVAARTKGNRIDLQPLSKLETRGILRQTIAHELLHVFIEHEAAPALPLWFREGLVPCLMRAGLPQTPARLPASDTSLRQRDDPAVAREAYHQSAARVQSLINRYGEATVLSWLKRGLPLEVTNASASSAATNSR